MPACAGDPAACTTFDKPHFPRRLAKPPTARDTQPQPMASKRAKSIQIIEQAGSVTIVNGAGKTGNLSPYLQRVTNDCERIELEQFGSLVPKSVKLIPLAKVYVSLDTQEWEREEVDEPQKQQPRELLPALDVLGREPRLVILGDPGSGKSTFFRYVAHCLACARLGNEEASVKKWPASLHKCLPFSVELKWFADWMAKKNIKRADESHLWEYLKTEVLKSYEDAWEPLGDVLNDRTFAGRIVFFLDGLDEVYSDDHRELVIGAINEFSKSGRGACRIAVTCREATYAQTEWRLDAKFHVTRLASLSDGTESQRKSNQVQEFVEAWFSVIGQPALAKEILASFGKQPRLRELACNPMNLTNIVLLRAGGTPLPENRAELWRAVIHQLLFQRDRAKDKAHLKSPLDAVLDRLHCSEADLHHSLGRMFFDAHQHHPPDAPPTMLSRSALHEMAKRLRDDTPWADELVENFTQRPGLLRSRARDRYCCPHLSFQEWLAAWHLAGQPRCVDEMSRLLGTTEFRQQWREVAKWLAEQWVHILGRPDLVLALAKALCNGDPAAMSPCDIARAKLASEILGELGKEKIAARPLGCELLAAVRPVLASLLTTERLEARDRAAAGMVLGQLGDLREGVGCGEKGVPVFKWSAEFPAGDFTLGEGKKKRRILDAYRMSIYPVTVQQFAAFLAAGYREAGPKDYEQAEFQTPNHPRVGVSWYEATAFCAWVSAQTKNAIRLPTEAEWERAAAGDGKKGREFAWSDAKDDGLSIRCNMGGTGIGHPSAVGIFPTGNTPEGIADMTGNVWEWCASRYNDDSEDASKPVAEIKSDQSGVVRGGSWGYGYPDYLRASFRTFYPPGYRYDFIGFRVVVVGAAC